MCTDRHPNGYPDTTDTSPSVRWDRWAPLPWPVLLYGENGTGKTRLARHLHDLSRRTGPFVDFSMAQVADSLEVAELCGYAAGSFTGALHNHPGVFEDAQAGTVFLDEIGLASPVAQGTLLKILDTSSVRRIGENRSRRLDFRLIAATNADLEAMVTRGAFRDDLLGRFGFHVVHLLPLRQRRKEILPLAATFLEAAAIRINRTVAPRLSPQVQRLCLRAPWPHNIRDLENLCRYVAGCSSDEVQVGDLPAQFLASVGVENTAPVEPMDQRLHRMLARTGGNKSEAARRLGISRQHAHRLLRKVN